jgi:hypothetical protein
MKIIGCVAILLLASVPAWSAAKKITVAELKGMLQTMHDQKKSDADVAAALKQVQLSEELNLNVMNSLAENVPGQLSTEQIYVLEARSATLPPPASDLPNTPPPDPAAQQAMLAKAGDYISKTYAQLPTLNAVKTTLRFQDNMEALDVSSGMHSSARDATMGTGLSLVQANQFIRYINATDINVSLDHGAERLPVDKTRWGANRMTGMLEPDPSLPQVFREASDAESIKWLRWEMVNGKAAAVYSFQVPKKKAHVAVDVCCFPDLDQTGRMNYSAPTQGTLGSNTPHGNMQTTTDWHPYKQNNLPYHGELFIDPDTGIVVRMIAAMEPKNSDVVHQDDTRVDYGPVAVGGKTLILPVRTVVNTIVVPNGEAGAGGYSERCTLFTSEYKSYKLAQ